MRVMMLSASSGFASLEGRDFAGSSAVASGTGSIDAQALQLIGALFDERDSCLVACENSDASEHVHRESKIQSSEEVAQQGVGATTSLPLQLSSVKEITVAAQSSSGVVDASGAAGAGSRAQWIPEDKSLMGFTQACRPLTLAPVRTDDMPRAQVPVMQQNSSRLDQEQTPAEQQLLGYKRKARSSSAATTSEGDSSGCSDLQLGGLHFSGLSTLSDELPLRGSSVKCPRTRSREYIDQLKQDVANLVFRIKALSQTDGSAVRELDLSTCVTAVTKLLTLRFAAVTDIKLWQALVTPEFELQLPAGMLPGLDKLCGPPTGTLRPDGLRAIHGLTQVMQDVAHLQQFLRSILLAFQVQIPGQPTPSRNGFHLLPSVCDSMAIVSGNTLMANWTLTVETLADYSFVVTDGMLDCRFAPDGRIDKLVLIYDLLSLAGKMQEFRHAKVMMQQAALAALQEQLQEQQHPPDL